MFQCSHPDVVFSQPWDERSQELNKDSRKFSNFVILDLFFKFCSEVQTRLSSFCKLLWIDVANSNRRAKQVLGCSLVFVFIVTVWLGEYAIVNVC